MTRIPHDWRARLVRAHAKFFDDIRIVEGRDGQVLTCMGWPSVGVGWQDILVRLFARMESAIAPEPAATITILQIKEKFGTLRIYVATQNMSEAMLEAVGDAIDLAETRSAFVCETCGRRGHLWLNAGWYLTACHEHGEGKPLRPKAGREGMQIITRIRPNQPRVTAARRYDFERDEFVSIPIPPDYDVARSRWRDDDG
jgi:hypothetical protein